MLDLSCHASRDKTTDLEVRGPRQLLPLPLLLLLLALPPPLLALLLLALRLRLLALPPRLLAQTCSLARLTVSFVVRSLTFPRTKRGFMPRPLGSMSTFVDSPWLA